MKISLIAAPRGGGGLARREASELALLALQALDRFLRRGCRRRLGLHLALLLLVDDVDRGKTLTGTKFAVPKQERHGGLARRPWHVAQEEELVTGHWDDLLGRVQVKPDGCLTSGSIEFLEKYTGGFIGAKG